MAYHIYVRTYVRTQCTTKSVMYDLLSLTASGDDFMLPAVTTVTFLVVDSPSTGQDICIDVTIVDDTNFEGDHMFTMMFDTLSPPATSTGSPATITIGDNGGKLLCRRVCNCGRDWMYVQCMSRRDLVGW